MSFETIGADIEVFAVDSNGKHISMCGKVGGTKEKPKQIKELQKGFMLQEDNVSIEYNIPPTSSRNGFLDNIKTMRNYITGLLKEKDLFMSTHCAVSFDPDQLKHPKAKVFGCEPDYNAWTKSENPKPVSTDATLRSAGGHIHVGINSVDMLAGIQAMDIYLGVPFILYDSEPSSVKRRELYGKAGAMRPKPYGFEYRVLSNKWMFDDDLITYVYHNTALAMRWAEHINHLMTKEKAKEIQDCINTSDAVKAKQLMEQYGVPTLEDIVDRYKTASVKTSPNYKGTSLSEILKHYSPPTFTYVEVSDPTSGICPSASQSPAQG